MLRPYQYITPEQANLEIAVGLLFVTSFGEEAGLAGNEGSSSGEESI